MGVKKHSKEILRKYECVWHVWEINFASCQTQCGTKENNLGLTQVLVSTNLVSYLRTFRWAGEDAILSYIVNKSQIFYLLQLTARIIATFLLEDFYQERYTILQTG